MFACYRRATIVVGLLGTVAAYALWFQATILGNWRFQHLGEAFALVSLAVATFGVIAKDTPHHKENPPCDLES